MAQIITDGVIMPFKQIHQSPNHVAEHYLTAKQRLNVVLECLRLNESQKLCVQNVITQIEQLANAKTLTYPAATDLLNDTAALLNNTMTAEAYHKKAQTVQGKPSLGMKVLGALMITLGAVVAGLCATLAAATGITLSGEGFFGAGMLAAGIGIFSGGARSGLSQAMSELANNIPQQEGQLISSWVPEY